MRDWYYADSSGNLLRGWQYIKGKQYWFEKNGYPYMYVKGIYYIDGKEYEFDSNGALIY